MQHFGYPNIVERKEEVGDKNYERLFKFLF
jgi:hypothetical protein